ncbi:hypothetical protein EDB81DRAFT_876498 [Dactylonectria macrodidyma]|uniref:DUF1996 domain-containing protein n=1 Tax=Dactylonectria macrodidyma TaxID=307937 RepID=A0A9P9FPL2_9HYPO|nr:hypothetical protein EDB81DRAFT_876498 [Dactylonectria macrodidyma]
MKFTAVAPVAVLAGTALAKDTGTFSVLHFKGKELTKGRMDPIISPGQTFSHVHSVMGGSGFSITATGEDLQNSNCSNALVKGDNSAYWFPSLYFHDPETGDFESVDLYYFNAYYFFEATNDDIKPFPVGLNMVSGSAMSRVVPEAGATKNLDPSQGPVNPARLTCPRLNNNYVPPSWDPDSDGSESGVGDTNNLGEGVGFPDRTCDGLYSPLRADVHFPSCYNPDAGLTSYKNNMAWPEDNDGKLDCPDGWIHVPHLFYEAYWDTQSFKGRWTEGQGEQPFVFSNGDVTGYSNHADFMAGWDEDLLQHIIDTCNTGFNGMDTCAGLTYGLNEDECTIPSQINEKVSGTLSKLPGDNPLSGFKYGNGDSGSSSDDDDLSAAGSSSKTSGGDAATSSAIAVSSTAEYAAADETTSKAISQETDSAQAVATSTAVATYSVIPAVSSIPSVSEVAQETSLDSSHTTTTCKRRTHTVWNTVTITKTADSATSQTAPSYKRDHVRRHAHSHVRGRH